MDAADFTPLRPRRHPATTVVIAEAAPSLTGIEPTIVPDVAPVVAPVSDDEPTPEGQIAVAPEPEPSTSAADGDDVAQRDEDEEERLAAVRQEAVRFASIATARALRVALADNAEALTRYVDDALRACGRFGRATVRLHPADAASYRPRKDVDVVVDASCARGDVVVETGEGGVRAGVEDRAELLARAAAHV